MASISGRYGSVTLTNADEYVKNWTLDYNADLYETTNFDDSSGGRSYIGGYTGWSGTFEANYSTANTVVPGDTGTIILRTSTGATGFWSGDVVITNMSINAPVDGLVTQTYTFQGSGALTANSTS
jgi:predicted secreted protein